MMKLSRAAGDRWDLQEGWHCKFDDPEENYNASQLKICRKKKIESNSKEKYCHNFADGFNNKT